ncbi:MAG TPA: hypothetical protein VHT91_01200 [Kofleriaceae bacterium]|nr:hypothetical protein [Kofleriaceae bacterium]
MLSDRHDDFLGLGADLAEQNGCQRLAVFGVVDDELSRRTLGASIDEGKRVVPIDVRLQRRSASRSDDKQRPMRDAF